MNIIFIPKVNSTNIYAKENIVNLDDKTIISTDIQTNGKGRFERNWNDLGKKNIFMTFVLKPDDKMHENFANLTQYLSVCVCNEIETLGIKPEIKWPNDILIKNKKIAGILAEAVIKKDMLQGIALGIGINVHARREDIDLITKPATALNLEGINIEKNILINNIAERFFDKYEKFLQNGFPMIKNDYGNYAIKPENMTISVYNKTFTGFFEGFDQKGQLLLKTDNEILSFNMGELI